MTHCGSLASTRAPIHAGQRPDPYTGARAMPIYQTTCFVFERHRARRGLLQPAGVRQHLLADHEPDRGGVRGADRQPGGRRRRRGLRQRPGGAGRRALHDARSRATTSSPRSALYGGTITQLKHLSRKLAHRRRRSSTRTTWTPGARRCARDQGALRRDDRQSRRQCARHRGGGRRSRTSTARR